MLFSHLCPKINAINVIFWKCNSFQLQSSLFSVGIRWAPLLFLFFVHHCTPLRSSCWRGKIKLISLAQQLIEWYVHTLIGTFMQISFAVQACFSGWSLLDSYLATTYQAVFWQLIRDDFLSDIRHSPKKKASFLANLRVKIEATWCGFCFLKQPSFIYYRWTSTPLFVSVRSTERSVSTSVLGMARA